jgi:hypothetical protein
MWPEPLAATARDIDEYRFAVDLTDGSGTTVATVACLVNRGARCGYLADLNITAPNGAPRQIRRAIVLAVREACRHAQALGITSTHAEFTPAMRVLGERLAGRAAEPHGPRFRVAVDLAQTCSHLLNTTDNQGNDR